MSDRGARSGMEFYNNSISLGTKIAIKNAVQMAMFYNNSISLGTKIAPQGFDMYLLFYNNSISLGTKIKISFFLSLYPVLQ